MALTANDPLSDQREREEDGKTESEMLGKIFNNPYVNVVNVYRLFFT